MYKFFTKIILVATITLMLSSCCSSIFISGSGASKSIVLKKKQWYALWGLAQLNKVNLKVLAGNATNYTVKTEFSFGDFLTNVFTSIISIERKTITVVK